jgi:hypothetical protein
MVKYIVFGASGLTGGHLVDILQSNQEDYLAIYRKNTQIKYPNNSLVYEDILTIDEKLLQNTHIFCCLGSSLQRANNKDDFKKIAVDLVVDLANTCAKHNCASFNVITGMNSKYTKFILYSHAKTLLEEKLPQITLKQLNMFRPSFLKGERAEFRLNEKIILGIFDVITKLHINKLFFGKLKLLMPVESKTLALSMYNFVKKEESNLENKEKINKISNFL